MNYLIDKIILFIFSSYMYFNIVEFNSLFIIPMLLCIIFICINFAFNKRYTKVIAFLIFLVLSFIYPYYLCFLSIFIYDLLNEKNKYYIMFSLFSFFFLLINSEYILLQALELLLVFILNYKTNKMNELSEKYILLRDTSKESLLELEKENNNIIDREFFEISSAKLEERNSIARDIHDNVGHLLSSSIIQIGAIKTVYDKDEKLINMLDNVSTSLTNAMDSIRRSIHKIYNETSNIIAELNGIINDFNFCNIDFIYEDEFLDLDMDIKIALISITKEALNNISKHSNATNVAISIKKYNAFIQYIIQDNGTNIAIVSEENIGIGIKNIKKRINNLNGFVSITTDDGFKIFINIPFLDNMEVKK